MHKCFETFTIPTRHNFTLEMRVRGTRLRRYMSMFMKQTCKQKTLGHLLLLQSMLASMLWFGFCVGACREQFNAPKAICMSEKSRSMQRVKTRGSGLNGNHALRVAVRCSNTEPRQCLKLLRKKKEKKKQNKGRRNALRRVSLKHVILRGRSVQSQQTLRDVNYAVSGWFKGSPIAKHSGVIHHHNSATASRKCAAAYVRVLPLRIVSTSLFRKRINCGVVSTSQLCIPAIGIL